MEKPRAALRQAELASGGPASVGCGSSNFSWDSQSPPMNVERLHTIAAELRRDLDQTDALSLLQNLVSSLSDQVSQPHQPQYQQQTSRYLTQLLDALRKARVNAFSPTWQQVIGEIGATALTGSELADAIEDIFARNQITPSVAQEELQDILNRLLQISAALDQLLASCRTLKIGTESLSPGECELGVLVPRVFLDNQLDRFATELEELHRIFGVFAEVATGARPGFEIKTISSTDLSVYLEVSAIVAACIATALERIIALYKQLLEIRKLQGELAKQGLEKKNLKGIEEHANGVMESGIDKLVKEIISEYLKKGDAGRRNELSIELKYSLKKLANRIDRGFNIEVRMAEPEVAAENPEEATEEEKALLKAHERVSQATENMQFLRLEGEPVLQLSESKPDKAPG